MDNNSKGTPMNEDEKHEQEKLKKQKELDNAMQALLYFYQKKRIELNFNFTPVIKLNGSLKPLSELEKLQKNGEGGKEEKKAEIKIKTPEKTPGALINHKLFVTQITAMDPKTGMLRSYSGPHIIAVDKKEAQGLIDNTGQGYCEIIGELIGMIDTQGNDVKDAYRDN